MRGKDRYILFIILVLMSSSVLSQNGMNSPYSRYGLGVLSEQQVGLNRSMGGIGYGMRQRNRVNLLNPASYSTVDTLSFILDLGFSLQNGNFVESGRSVNAKNASVDYIAMQYRVQPKIGMTVAYMPFSKVGYGYSLTDIVRDDEDGVVTAQNSYSGSGALNQVVVGLGWRPFNWLSIGANGSYIYGDILHTIANTYSQSGIYNRRKRYTASLSALRYDIGAQFSAKIADKNFVFGAIVSPAVKMKGDEIVTDLMMNGKVVELTDSISIASHMSLPLSLGVGASLSSSHLTVAADISYQQWSTASFFNSRRGVDRVGAAIGASYLYDINNKNIFKRASYQLGLSMKQPYYGLDGGVKGAMEYGLTAGLSLPVSNVYHSATIHLSGEYVRIQPSMRSLIIENYMRINLGVTFCERWFAKWMVE